MGIDGALAIEGVHAATFPSAADDAELLAVSTAVPRTAPPALAAARLSTYPVSEDAIDRLRAICLALPEAVEQETWGDPTFRVRGKIFAMAKQDDGRISVWCKAPPGSQLILIGADPDRFFAPPYVGPKGWIGMRLDNES